MYFLYFLNLYLWYGFGLPSYPLFSSYNNEDMGYVMLCNACNVMHHSPPHVHAYITSTPYSLHTLGQLFLQTSVLPEVDLVGEAFPGYFALVTLSDLQSL